MVSQKYNTHAAPEEIISGNDAVMKCSVPSFMSDFVDIVSWVDSEGSQFMAGLNYGKAATMTK